MNKGGRKVPFVPGGFGTLFHVPLHETMKWNRCTEATNRDAEQDTLVETV